MCGIIGYFSTVDRFNAERFAAANNMVKYRGPDDFGYLSVDRNFNIKEWRDENMRDFASNVQPFGALGFRRLSIIDLTPRGHQPMHEGNRKYWIVYNGEVYNYREIRSELVDIGYTFRSRTDTEVILKSYLEWGNDCLRRFNGMWAFCILDIPRKKLFCARDRFGIKPFYYYLDGSRFVFGSEVKQVLMLKPNDASMNHTVFFDYLALGAYGNETRETFFGDIYRILPGEYIDMDLSSKTIALFGLGDQKGYPENFLDGTGLLADILAESGARIVGHTSTEGYSYEQSRAVKDNKFIGLAIDFENQGSMNKERISRWIEQLRSEFQ